MTATAVVSMRVPDALADALNALADTTGRSLSQTLRDAAEAFLRPPVTLCAAAGGRLRLLVPAGPIGGESSNLCAGETLALTVLTGGGAHA